MSRFDRGTHATAHHLKDLEINPFFCVSPIARGVRAPTGRHDDSRWHLSWVHDRYACASHHAKRAEINMVLCISSIVRGISRRRHSQRDTQENYFLRINIGAHAFSMSQEERYDFLENRITFFKNGRMLK
jgi:hypothetical protein